MPELKKRRYTVRIVLLAVLLFWGFFSVEQAHSGFGPILNSDLLVSGSGSVDYRGASVACDGNRYLAVWKQAEGIFGRFISKTGEMDPPFPISTVAPSLEIRPEVAFNGTHYLVVWFKQNSYSSRGHIMGMFFTTDGNPASQVLTLTDQEQATENDLKIASDGQDFLVIWADGRTTATKSGGIYGQRVSGSGNLLGANFLISNWPGRNSNAAVGFGGSKYLVIWSQSLDPNDPNYVTDIYGAFVDTSGVVSSPLVICNANNHQGTWRKAGVAFDGTNFLAVWEDFRLGYGGASRPYGARVTQDGTVLDPNGIDMCANPGLAGPKGPRAAFGGGNWLVAWGGTRILGVRVNSSGVVADYASGIALYKNTPSGSQWGPELAFDGLNFLVIWLHQTTAGGPYALYAQLAGQTVDNHAPTANAGPDQTKHAGILVTLDGSKSSDPDGDVLSYKWEFTAWPDGSQTSLSDPTAVNPTFTPNQTGEYRLRLVVTDSKGASSAPDEVVISTTNSAPVANAGPNQTIMHLNQPVQLNGSGSTDADNDPLTHRWEFEVVAEGSNASLTGANTATPTFTPDRYGTYVVRLVVNDGWADSTPQKVTITSQNVKPVANAGPDQLITTIGTPVILDGSGSTDANGDQLSYQWSLTKPDGTPGQLSDPTAAKPTFVADMHGDYIAQLIVSDGLLSSDPDTIKVSFTNVPPVANAGPDQVIDKVGFIVTLDGTGSSDANGDKLSYLWSVTKPGGLPAQLSDPSAVNPTFTADVHGTYVAQLTVSDGFGGSHSDTVTISFANVPPVAEAGDNQFVQSYNTTVTLDGSQSYDGNGDTLTYAWSFTDKPNGSSATLTGADTVKPSFVADLHGDYVVQLTVSDGFGGTTMDTVTASFNNLPPAASAAGAGAYQVGQTVTLDGTASSDPNQDPLTYKWSLLSAPAGSAAGIADPAAQITSLALDAKGQYEVQLVVSDGVVNSPPATVLITATLDTQAVIVAIQDLQQVTIGNLAPTAFKNSTMKNAVINKLSSVVANIEAGRYQEALGQLQHDLLAKTDGCATSGAPDKNDWIKDCGEQATVYAEIQRTITMLQQLQ